uniref:Uncharacterized protein n=1 Tax=Rhizophora mucronata TaxID=61149 RepID=A0A2P2NWJ1_RHIMU
MSLLSVTWFSFKPLLNMSLCSSQAFPNSPRTQQPYIRILYATLSGLRPLLSIVSHNKIASCK